jgi:hypothetical protein
VKLRLRHKTIARFISTSTPAVQMPSPVHLSAATNEFKSDVQSYLDGQPTARVRLEGHVPAIKVRRLLAQLAEAEPGLQIEDIVIRARSGCSDFSGSVDVHTPNGTHVFDFVWDCRWRAELEGWTDYFGFPDQARAAREFDWRCFQTWERRSSN